MTVLGKTDIPKTGFKNVKESPPLNAVHKFS